MSKETKHHLSEKDFKVFEVEIKATILYQSWEWVDLFDFNCEIFELIDDLFKRVEIPIKNLEIIDVKEK